MIIYLNTSLLTANSQTVVNTVNTVGVMGKGLAAAFKKRYPDMFARYKELCEAGEFDIGKLWLWKAPNQWVLNFPTKKDWKNPAKLEYIELGLQKFIDSYASRGINDISFPRLGCGNGGLAWDNVKPLMERYLKNLPIKIYIHDYSEDIGSPEHDTKNEYVGVKRLSFDAFFADLAEIIKTHGGVFKTFVSNNEFIASVSEENRGALVISRGQRKTSISEDELYDVWTALLNGPLSVDVLSGQIRQEAYYVLPILAQLPYIRQIRKSTSDDIAPTFAIEFNSIKNELHEIDLSSKERQDNLKWG